MTIKERDKLKESIENDIAQVNNLLTEKFNCDYMYIVEYRGFHSFAAIYKAKRDYESFSLDASKPESMEFKGDLVSVDIFIQGVRHGLTLAAYHSGGSEDA